MVIQFTQNNLDIFLIFFINLVHIIYAIMLVNVYPNSYKVSC